MQVPGFVKPRATFGGAAQRDERASPVAHYETRPAMLSTTPMMVSAARAALTTL
jgi:hypothetical protein